MAKTTVRCRIEGDTNPGKDNQDVRASLIEAARQCFTRNSYDRVSIRQIANKAGVNMAMIRYYFGSKLGLFEAMVLEVTAPMREQAIKLTAQGDIQSLGQLLIAYSQVMGSQPEFPKFLMRLMNQETSKEAQQVVQSMFAGLLCRLPGLISQAAPVGQDPLLVKMSVLSLMIFPYLIPDSMAKLQGFQFNADFYHRLAEHNALLLTRGLEPA
jgi:AcrR family transcriptional regulator